MKILVIDNDFKHRKSARQTLGTDHDLTVVGSHDEAEEAIRGYDNKYLGPDNSYGRTDLYWDAVLSDLLMPAGKYMQKGKGVEYFGQEMPIGWAFAIRAALFGAKYVAVVTDIGHHRHPASAMLDVMDESSLYLANPTAIFNINDAKAIFTNRVPRVDLVDWPTKECDMCSGSGKNDSNRCMYCRDGRVCSKGKDWGSVLDRLLGLKKKRFNS